MIRVTIDLVTTQTGSAGKQLREVHIVNDGSGTPEMGFYSVLLLDENGDEIQHTSVRGFARLDNDATELVRQALNALAGR